MEKEKIEIGMVFTFGNHTGIEYVVTGLDKDSATLERITQRSEGCNRHGAGYGWFADGKTRFIRKMRKKELAYYQANDPVCSLEKGIYKALKSVDTLLLQPCITEDEVVKILHVGWEDNNSGNRKIHKLDIIFLQFGKQKEERLSYHSREKMACIHWFWENFMKINIHW